MKAERVLVCAGCDRQVEVCAFCETDDCVEATCYRCMIVDLRETIVRPHEHGG